MSGSPVSPLEDSEAEVRPSLWARRAFPRKPELALAVSSRLTRLPDSVSVWHRHVTPPPPHEPRHPHPVTFPEHIIDQFFPRAGRGLSAGPLMATDARRFATRSSRKLTCEGGLKHSSLPCKRQDGGAVTRVMSSRAFWPLAHQPVTF